MLGVEGRKPWPFAVGLTESLTESFAAGSGIRTVPSNVSKRTYSWMGTE